MSHGTTVLSRHGAGMNTGLQPNDNRVVPSEQPSNKAMELA
jgi:hypothetical protein